MEVAEGLEWLHIYFIDGELPKHARFRSEVKDPPTAGWQHAFLLRGEKRSTIFCPVELTSWQVSNNCSEVAQALEPKEWRHQATVKRMLDQWALFQRLGFTRDYDLGARVLKLLGAEVPTVVLSKDGTANTSSRGGKPPADKLLKPIKRKGKRGEFLAYFMDEETRTRSVRDVMAQFGISRSNALSYLFMLNKDHGLGYGLVGDAANVILPEGCTDPFVE